MKYNWNKFITEGELKTVGIVACLNNKQQFLVIRRSDIDRRAGQWTLPGGHIDEFDGSIEAGAVRELDEEAGLKCSVGDLQYLGQPKEGLATHPRHGSLWFQRLGRQRHVFLGIGWKWNRI